jgi:hypothetical protein
MASGKPLADMTISAATCDNAALQQDQNASPA